VARCLAAQGHHDAGQHALAPALAVARAGTYAPAWEALAVLAHLQKAMGRTDEADATGAAARDALAAVTAGIADRRCATASPSRGAEPPVLQARAPT
jgi:hypothetical protein